METTEVTNMIDSLLADNHNDAVEAFQSVISTKIASAIEDKKIEIAQSLGAPRHEPE